MTANDQAWKRAMKDSERMGVGALIFVGITMLVAVFGGFFVVIVSCFTSGRFC